MSFPPENTTLVPLARCTVDNPDGRHFCQLHHDELSLAKAIFQFTRAGLHEGETIFLLAPAARLRHVLNYLRADGLDPDALVRAGKLSVRTPTDIRQECERDGKFDLAAFRESFNDLFAQYDRGIRMRLYGELSNTFWHEGDVETAVRLEYICDELLAGRRIAVFCGYLLDALEVQSYRAEIEHLCRVHNFLPPTPDDARLRCAVDEASLDVLGIPLSVALNRAGSNEASWWRRLPLARRTVLWLQANMPSAMIRVLDLARANYR